ncbi:MAG: hypothetical protein EB084_08620 [Proteobacteria bacterium]|nr:hypothetical protein [Pseudomonadota bacterium]
MPSRPQLSAAGFRNAEQYEASRVAAHRMLHQERATIAGSDASTHGDTRELAPRLQRALDLEARTHATPRAYQSSQARQRQQLQHSTLEGAQPRYTLDERARDAVTQVPRFLLGAGEGGLEATRSFVVGGLSAVAHPINTVRGLGHAITNPNETAGKVYSWVRTSADKMDAALNRGDVRGFGREFGDFSGTLMLNTMPAGFLPKRPLNALARKASFVTTANVTAAVARVPALARYAPMVSQGMKAVGKTCQAACNTPVGQAVSRAYTRADAILTAPLEDLASPRSRVNIEALADTARATLPKGNRPKTVASIETAKGATFTGRSSYTSPRHPVVDQLTREYRNIYGGHCAEMEAVSEALRGAEKASGKAITTVRQARTALKGGHVQTAKVRGVNSPSHASAHKPCSGCAPVLSELGLKYHPKL